MKRTFFAFVGSCLFLVGLFSWLPSSAFALAPAEAVLEVTGTLERVASGEEGEVIFLNVAGKAASGPLAPDCIFLGEKGAAMERSDFLRLYLKRYVTLELGESDGVVRVCRLGS